MFYNLWNILNYIGNLQNRCSVQMKCETERENERERGRTELTKRCLHQIILVLHIDSIHSNWTATNINGVSNSTLCDFSSAYSDFIVAVLGIVVFVPILNWMTSNFYCFCSILLLTEWRKKAEQRITEINMIMRNRKSVCVWMKIVS